MNLDDIEIKNPKCFLITLTIGIAFEISMYIAGSYFYWNQ